MYRPLIFLVLMVAASFTSCRKSPPEGSTVIVRQLKFTAENNLDSRVRMVIYKTKEDYKHARAPFFEKDIYPYSSEEITLEGEANSFYLDWFTENSLYTNWGFKIGGTYDYEHKLRSITSNGIEVVSFNTSYQLGPSRSIFIDGDKPEILWVAIDKVDYQSQSIWNSLTDNEKVWQLSVTKTMEYKLIKRNAEGNTIVQQGMYSPGNTGSIHFATAGFRSNTSSSQQYDFQVRNMNLAGKVTGDTLYVSDDPEGLYVLVKKK